MGKRSQLHDEDFVLWTKEQAAALRRAKGSNLPLDWENLAEEIEDLGKSDRRELTSQVRRILRHLYQLEASPAAAPRRGWRATIDEARAEIAVLFEDSPSLRRDVEGIIAKQAPVAERLAADDLGRHREFAQLVSKRLVQGGSAAAQVLGDWFPQRGG